MNLHQKTQLASRAIENIVNHTDEDLAVRAVYLTHLQEVIQQGLANAEVEVSERIKSIADASGAEA